MIHEGTIVPSAARAPLDLVSKARQIRRDTLVMLAEAESGHIGTSLSMVDICVALYYAVMRVDPRRPRWLDRDRFVLSKGHGAPALYAVLSDLGYFPAAECGRLRRKNGLLQGHPELEIPGIDIGTGSLGQGLSVAVGMALGLRARASSARVYCMLGDGECDEGQVWEAAMTAATFGVGNLVGIIDHNKLQYTRRLPHLPADRNLAARFHAFGWRTVEVDGHDFDRLVPALSEAGRGGEPTMIVAHTVKGKGVSFMEDSLDYCAVPPARGAELERALAAIGGVA